MAKAYWVASVDVNDPERYKQYVQENGAAFRKYGAKFLVRGGEQDSPDGIGVLRRRNHPGLRRPAANGLTRRLAGKPRGLCPIIGESQSSMSDWRVPYPDALGNCVQSSVQCPEFSALREQGGGQQQHIDQPASQAV